MLSSKKFGQTFLLTNCWDQENYYGMLQASIHTRLKCRNIVRSNQWSHQLIDIHCKFLDSWLTCAHRFEWLFLKDNRNFGEENFQFTLALRYLAINLFLTIALLRAIFTESVPPMSSTWMGNCKTDGRSFSRLMLCWGSRARREKFQRLEKGWSSCNKKNVPDSRLCLTRRLELTYTGYIWESEYTPGFDPMAIWTVRCCGEVMKLTLPCLPHLRWLKVTQTQRQRGRAGCVGSMSLCKKNGQTVD